MNFEKQYKDALDIRLEQNYRSTGNILDAANSVIKNNTGRKAKNFGQDSFSGDKSRVYVAEDERDEGRFVAQTSTERIGRTGVLSGILRFSTE